MSLKEITDLLNTRHNDAIKVVTKMLNNADFGVVTASSYRTTQGNEYKTYLLDKRQSLAVAAKLNTSLLMKIIDRWQELEQSNPVVPTTYIEALQALIESEKAKEVALAEVSKLTTICDREFGYCSTIRAAIYAGVHEKYFDWRVLKRWTVGIGMEVKKVPSPRFGYMNLYPIKAFQECYSDIDFDDLTPELVEDKSLLVIDHAN